MKSPIFRKYFYINIYNDAQSLMKMNLNVLKILENLKKENV